MVSHTNRPLRACAFMVLAAVVLAAAGGCSWMGRTVGKAQAKVERKVDSVEQGYEQGYKEEKAKNGQ